MKINVNVVDYTTMTLKQLEKEYTKEGQVLLDMISSNKYNMKDIEKRLHRFYGDPEVSFIGWYYVVIMVIIPVERVDS